MEIIINSGNVGKYAFLQNDEILILDSTETLPKSSKLKCPRISSQEQSNNEGKKDKSTEKQNVIKCACLSNCGNFFAVCDSLNLLHLWKQVGKSWHVLSSRALPRKCQKMIFSNSSSEIIIADRGGNVTSYSVTNHDSPGKFLLGHISLILDLSISRDDKYLVTCDRDGKIRISCYPNCYNIHSYCLGHLEFVSCVKFISSYGEFVLSSSGDGSIRLWNYSDGTETKCLKIFDDIELSKQCEVSCNEKNSKIFESSGNFAITNEQFRFSVRCIKYCHRYKLFLTLFYMQNGVAIYRLPNSAEENFCLVQFISLKNAAVDALFDVEGSLFILHQCKEEPILCFQYSKNTKMYSSVDDYSNSHFMQEIKKFYGDFEYLMNVQSDFEHLFKTCYEFSDDVDDSKAKPFSKRIKT